MQTILLIEDNSDILENLAEFLQMEGYKTLEAYNGKDGIALAKKFIPDLIICDFFMPGMNGHEVLCSLLNTLKEFNIPFIFSTSMSEISDKAKTLKLGASDYIVKPYEMELLLKVVNYWINCDTAVSA
ncbi:MAG: response regulator transcription factor [Chitinophagaceae bacterium]